MEAKICFVYCPSLSQLSTIHLLYNRDSEKTGLSNISCISSQSTHLSILIGNRKLYTGGAETHIFLCSPSERVVQQEKSHPSFILEMSPSLCNGQTARKPLLTQLLVPGGATREWWRLWELLARNLTALHKLPNSQGIWLLSLRDG